MDRPKLDPVTEIALSKVIDPVEQHHLRTRLEMAALWNDWAQKNIPRHDRLIGQLMGRKE